jgi:transcriptional regulator with XRE-family HTH domain
MGYGGKIEEQARARVLRAQAWTLADIAAELGVAKSSVSLWVRDVEFAPNPRRTARNRPPNKLQRAKAAEIEYLRAAGMERVGQLTDREFLMAGLGLYAGDRAKSGGSVHFANSNPAMIRFICQWFRKFFEPPETAFRIRLYLHQDLDLDLAEDFWARLCEIPIGQFHKAHRPPAVDGIRRNRHVYGCCHLRYSSTYDLRKILGMMEAMMLVPSPTILPG